MGARSSEAGRPPFSWKRCPTHAPLEVQGERSLLVGCCGCYPVKTNVDLRLNCCINSLRSSGYCIGALPVLKSPTDLEIRVEFFLTPNTLFPQLIAVRYPDFLFSFLFTVFGATSPVVLWIYSRLCIQEFHSQLLIHGTCVSHVQGKHLTHCTISPPVFQS